MSQVVGPMKGSGESLAHRSVVPCRPKTFIKLGIAGIGVAAIPGLLLAFSSPVFAATLSRAFLATVVYAIPETILAILVTILVLSALRDKQQVRSGIILAWKMYTVAMSSLLGFAIGVGMTMQFLYHLLPGK